MKKDWIYKFLKFSNDVNAVKKGKVGKRIGRRLGGKVSSNMMGKFFK